MHGAGNAALPRVPGFKVHKLLGKGSYGKVYKVEREGDKQMYALKEADLGAMSQAERADAVNEVRLMVSMSHPNVIRYYDSFLNGSKLCTVMEFAPYGDLRYYIEKGSKLRTPFPEEAIWRILLQLCKGLDSLHSSNIIHRDIKPANIFLCENDLLKIGDLGIAKALTSMAYARTQIGTPCYMAPEVWSGRSYSYSSDLWSLGAVLYEMMTFRVPIEGRSMQDLRMRIMAGKFAPVPAGRYSPELINYCHGLLSTDPKRRPTLQAILTSSAGTKWMRVLPPTGPPPPRRCSADGGKGLLDTIVVPRDLKQLPKKLPPSQYDGQQRPPASAPASRHPTPPSQRPSSAQHAHAHAGHAPAPSGYPPQAYGRPGVAANVGAARGRAPSPDIRQMQDAGRKGPAAAGAGERPLPLAVVQQPKPDWGRPQVAGRGGPGPRCASPAPRFPGIKSKPQAAGNAFKAGVSPAWVPAAGKLTNAFDAARMLAYAQLRAAPAPKPPGFYNNPKQYTPGKQPTHQAAGGVGMVNAAAGLPRADNAQHVQQRPTGAVGQSVCLPPLQQAGPRPGNAASAAAAAAFSRWNVYGQPMQQQPVAAAGGIARPGMPQRRVSAA